MSRVDFKYWVILHPHSTGDVVAKMNTAGGAEIIDEVYEYDDFTIVEVSDQSSLTQKSTDWSSLSDYERELLSQVFPR